MKKQYLILQPPHTDKFTFLVDDISNKGNWGRTTDIDKIEYNRRLLGEEFNVDLKVKLLLTDKGGSGVFPIGRFLTVIQIRADENEGIMTFMDFDIPLKGDELRNALLNEFSLNITNQWLMIQELMLSEFRDEDDNVVLHKPVLPNL